MRNPRAGEDESTSFAAAVTGGRCATARIRPDGNGSIEVLETTEEPVAASRRATARRIRAVLGHGRVHVAIDPAGWWVGRAPGWAAQSERLPAELVERMETACGRGCDGLAVTFLNYIDGGDPRDLVAIAVAREDVGAVVRALGGVDLEIGVVDPLPLALANAIDLVAADRLPPRCPALVYVGSVGEQGIWLLLHRGALLAAWPHERILDDVAGVLRTAGVPADTVLPTLVVGGDPDRRVDELAARTPLDPAPLELSWSIPVLAAIGAAAAGAGLAPTADFSLQVARLGVAETVARAAVVPLLLLALAIGAWNVAGTAERDRLELKTARIRTELQWTRNLHDSVADIRAKAERIGVANDRLRERQEPCILSALQSIYRALPAEAWVTAIEIDGSGTCRFQGCAADAGEVLAEFREDPAFHGAEFEGAPAIIRRGGRTADRFRIATIVRPAHGGGEGVPR